MKLELENYKDTWSESLPKFGIDWFYYPGAKPKVLEKHNRYRARIHMPAIIDDGSYFWFHVNVGRRVLGFEISLRPRRLAETK